MTLLRIEADDGPLFLCPRNGDSSEACNYYRAVLPARMTGGTVRHELEVSLNGRAPETKYFYDPHTVHEILSSCSAVLRGLGRPTIVPGRLAAAVPRMTELITLMNEVSPDAVWVEWDDYVSEQFGQLFIPNRDPQFARVAAADYQRVVFGMARTFIVATEELRRAVLRHRPAARVLIGRNAIDPTNFPERSRPARRRLCVGYAGTISHWVDMGLAWDGLAAIARANADLQFYGWHPRQQDAGFVPGRYSFRGTPYTYGGMIPDFGKFHECIAGFDVAVAPLVGYDFNVVKSPQKWFEHSLYETPMVVSDLPPYACVEHGVTGLKARNAEEFTRYLRLLCSDADLRARIGKAARDAVLEKHTTANYAAQWRATVGEQKQEKGRLRLVPNGVAPGGPSSTRAC